MVVVTIAATGAIKKKVACQPIDCIILAPNKRPSTDPAEYAELNTPIAIERRRKAVVTVANCPAPPINGPFASAALPLR